MISSIIHFELLQLRKNNFLLGGALFFIILSVYTAFNGIKYFEKQQSVIYSIDTTQNNRINTLYTYYQKVDTISKEGKKQYRIASDILLADNFIKEHVFFIPHPLSKLSIGKKDNQTYYHSIAVRSNLFVTPAEEISNPQKLMTGNLDFSFLIMFLAPLLIIGWNYNLMSSEKENGTLAILAVYSNNLNKVAFIRTGFRFTIFTIFISMVTISLAVILVIPFSTELFLYILITNLYLLFWFGIVYLVINFNGSGKMNAIILACIWTVLLFVIPSSINRYMESGAINLERTDLTNAMRDYTGDLWSLSKKEIIDKLKSENINFDLEKYPVLDSGAYRMFAYYELSQLHFNNTGNKDLIIRKKTFQKTTNFNPINPVFALLSTYNDLSRSDIGSHNHFLEQIEKIQTERRHFIYSYVLSKKPFWENDFKQLPKVEITHKPLYWELINKNMIILLISSILLTLLGWYIGSKEFRKVK